jgi:hypothetical protein
MINALPLLLGPEGYQISRSVRLRSSVNAYFSDTLGSGYKKTFTHSVWVKRGILGVAQTLFGGNSGTAALPRFYFTAADQLEWYSRDSASVVQSQITTNAVYRDPSAWYHIVLAYDTTQADANNRLRIYVNNVLQAVTITTALALNEEPNSTFPYGDVLIGIYRTTSLAAPFDGYLTEINFIEGYPTVAGISYNATTWAALNVSTLFGETNPATGVWQPKKYTGTYGTNGWYLNFSDNSAATAVAIGKDYSGNGNNWTPNNISVTAGATYDSMLDVPTQWADGGNGRGNYAVINPLTYAGTLANGNLQLTTFSAYGSNRTGTSTIAAQGDKFYWEVTKTSGTSTELDIGVSSDPNFLAANSSPLIFYNSTGYVRQNGVNLTTSVATYATNDVIGVAVDAVAKTIEFFKNGISQGLYSISFDGPYHALAFDDNGTNACVFTFNFGAGSGFSYTPPTGFKALNTLNLPTPTILKGNQYFDATTYTGQNTSLSVTNSGSMQPDFVWIKKRNGATDHNLTDAVRGTNRNLVSNSTAAEDTVARLTSFNSNGFTLAGAFDNTNISGSTYVGWQWKEGATQGFDIVTYTGNGTSQNISHSLGVAPRMMIVKKRSTTGNWPVYHASLGNATSPFLNLTNAANSQPNLWNSTTPTSSVFTVGSDGETNASAATFVAYLFAEVAGFSKFGSYTGNGSADGPFVFCGFRPKFVMVKRTDSVGSWWMLDSSRDTFNLATKLQRANENLAEETSYASIDMLSNGFKLRVSSTESNASGGTYIFAAFSESPFKNSLAR